MRRHNNRRSTIMNTQAEIILCPLTRPDTNGFVNKFCGCISDRGLNITTNNMNSVKHSVGVQSVGIYIFDLKPSVKNLS